MVENLCLSLSGQGLGQSLKAKVNNRLYCNRCSITASVRKCAVDGTDIGSSDHFLVWMKLSRASKTSKKRKRVIRRWRLDRFGDDEVKLSYQNALMAEVHEFSESTKSKLERGMKGQELVNEVVMEW